LINIVDFLKSLKTARYKGVLLYFPYGEELTGTVKDLANRTASEYIDLLDLLTNDKEYLKNIYYTEPLKWVRKLVVENSNNDLLIIDNTDVVIAMFKEFGKLEDFLSSLSYLEEKPALCFSTHRDESINNYFENKHIDRHPEQPTSINIRNIRIPL